jgi:flagellar hook-length control protein FliK
MESNFSFLANRVTSSPAADASPVPSSPHTSSAPGDFAEVLNGQALKAHRQHLAALDAPVQGLQVRPLGSNLTVITSDAPLPDLESLAQFARMQGLDESAVQALFGLTEAAKTAALTAGTLVADALAQQSVADSLGLATANATDLLEDATQAAQTGLDALSAQVSAAMLAAPQAPAGAAVPTVTGTALAAGTGMAVAQAAPSATALLNAGSLQASLMPLTANAWAGKATITAVETVPLEPPLAPQDAVRLTLAMPAEEITKRLAQMSGTGKETSWAALLAAGPAAKDQPSAIETVALDLPAGIDADLLASLTEAQPDQPNDVSTQAGAAGPASSSTQPSANAGGNSADTAQAQADQRALQFQQIADKMGQAAAQRLIAQIERGQWKMQMRMQPAALGSINVELDMHAGGLDALFSADNAVTRELMSQGSNKLRDTLTQAGMTVASVSVNGEQSRQSGGNSTPGKGRNTPSGTRPVNDVTSTTAAAPQGVSVATTDGLNVLA